jgi:signal peptidase I
MGQTKGRQEADEVDRQRRYSAEGVLGRARHRRREDQLTRPAAHRSHALGIALRTIVGFLLAATFVDAFLVSGLLFAARVTSNSMSPTLLGPHRAWNCRSCGRSFVRDLESFSAWQRAVDCTFCRAANETGEGIERPGQRVLVDRASLTLRPPKRWEVVVLDCPVSPRDWCVKRVIGLPGERVEVRDGEVWIDGARAQTPPKVTYTAGPPGGQRECTLGPDEYFLLGDNGPFSADSRTWEQPGVSRRRIIGRVLTW